MNGKGTTLTLAATLGSTSYIVLSNDIVRQSDLCGNQSNDDLVNLRVNKYAMKRKNVATLSKSWIDLFSDFEKSSSLDRAVDGKKAALPKDSLQNKQNCSHHSKLVKDLQLMTNFHRKTRQNMTVFVFNKSLDFRKEDQEGLLEQMSLGLPPT